MGDASKVPPSCGVSPCTQAVFSPPLSEGAQGGYRLRLTPPCASVPKKAKNTEINRGKPLDIYANLCYNSLSGSRTRASHLQLNTVYKVHIPWLVPLECGLCFMPNGL